MASFPWLHRLRRLRRICSILRILGVKKESKSFSSPQDDPKSAASQSTASGTILKDVVGSQSTASGAILKDLVGNEAPRSQPWSHFRGSRCCVGCVPFSAF